MTQREIGSKLRSKAFVISTLVLFLIALGAVVWGGISASSTQGIPVAATADTAQAIESLPGIETTQADSVDDALGMVEDGSVDAAVVPDEATGPYPYKIVAKDSYPETLVAMLSVSPTGRTARRHSAELASALLRRPRLRDRLPDGGEHVRQHDRPERRGREADAGRGTPHRRHPRPRAARRKVLGNTVLAMAQIVALALVAVVGLSVSGQSVALTGLGGPIAWFAVFFLFGFVLLAALFAAAGAMVSRQEDIGATTTPLTMLILAPYFLVIFFNDNPVVLGVMSYVPFSAPVAMPLRIYLGQVEWWEPVLSLAILIATCVAAVLVGARIYENAILRMGGRVKLREALAA